MNKLSPKIDKKAVGIGLKAGIIASLCCIIPLILIIFGLTSVTFALKFVQYKPHFIILSIIFLVGSFWYFSKKRKCCHPENKISKKWFIGTALGVHILTFLVLLYILFPNVSHFLYNLASLGENKILNSPNTLSLNHLTLEISGMTCSSCARGIEYYLEDLPGVIEAKVSFYSGRGQISYNSQKIRREQILESEIFFDSSPYKAKIYEQN